MRPITRFLETRGADPTNKERRQFIGGTVAALLASSAQPFASEDDDRTVNNPFILLLKGLYHQVPHLPDLGLLGVNLADTSYITTKIYPVFGIQGSQDQDDAIGNFYVSFSNPVCLYDLPGGAIAMQFVGSPVL